MIIPVVRYTIRCDQCGAVALDEEWDDYATASDNPEAARKVATEYDWGWSHQDGMDLCPTCTCETQGHEFPSEWPVPRFPFRNELTYQSCSGTNCRALRDRDGVITRSPNKTVVSDHAVIQACPGLPGQGVPPTMVGRCVSFAEFGGREGFAQARIGWRPSDRLVPTGRYELHEVDQPDPRLGTTGEVLVEVWELVT